MSTSQLPLVIGLGLATLMVLVGVLPAPRKQRNMQSAAAAKVTTTIAAEKAFPPGDEQADLGHTQLPHPGLGGSETHVIRGVDGQRLKYECPAGTLPVVQSAVYRTLDGRYARDVTALVSGSSLNEAASDDIHTFEFPVGHSSLEVDPAPGHVKELVVELACADYQPDREIYDM